MRLGDTCHYWVLQDNITYPDGTWISDSEWWVKYLGNHRYWKDKPPVRFEVGEERMADAAGEDQKIDVLPWSVNLFEVAIAGGQVLDVTFRLTGATDWGKPYGTVGPGDYDGNLHWSYRRVGDEVFTQLPEGWATARIAVPGNVTSVEYAFVVICTGGKYERADLEHKMKRVA